MVSFANTQFSNQVMFEDKDVNKRRFKGWCAKDAKGLNKPMINGSAIFRKSNFFYQNLKDAGHPYMVRWFAAFGDELCEDVMNIIAGFAFYGSTFPKFRLLKEMKANRLFDETLTLGMDLKLNVEGKAFRSLNKRMLDFDWRYADKFNRLSVPYMENLMLNGNGEERWNFCKRIFDAEKDGDEDDLKYIKPILFAWVSLKIQERKENQRRRFAAVLNDGYGRYVEQRFDENNCFRKRWKYPNGRKKKETECDKMTYIPRKELGGSGERWFYPKYLDCGNMMTKKEVLMRIDNERIDNFFGINLKAKPLPFLLWYFMTEGTKVYCIKRLDKALAEGDAENIVKYQRYTWLL